MQMSFLKFLQSSTKPQFALFATPFDVDAESVSEEFQMKVLDLKCDKQKQKYTDTVSYTHLTLPTNREV